jgi:hypothetical protein
MVGAEINLDGAINSPRAILICAARGATQFTDHQRQGWNLYDPTINIVGQKDGVSRWNFVGAQTKLRVNETRDKKRRSMDRRYSSRG